MFLHHFIELNWNGVGVIEVRVAEFWTQIIKTVRLEILSKTLQIHNEATQT